MGGFTLFHFVPFLVSVMNGAGYAGANRRTRDPEQLVSLPHLGRGPNCPGVRRGEDVTIARDVTSGRGWTRYIIRSHASFGGAGDRPGCTAVRRNCEVLVRLVRGIARTVGRSRWTGQSVQFSDAGRQRPDGPIGPSILGRVEALEVAAIVADVFT